MTADALISLYPYPTYIQGVSFKVHSDPSTRRARWNVPVAHSVTHHVQHKSIAAAEFHPALDVEMGIGQDRFIGDAECWVISYDMDGNCTDRNTEIQSKYLRTSGWRMRLDQGRVYMELREAMLSTLR